MEGVKWTDRSGTWAFIAGLSMLACSVGCKREPSAEELAPRINWDSPTNEEDRKALVGYGQEAIDPCIKRALSEPADKPALATVRAMMMGEILRDAAPEAAMKEIEKRYETADLRTRSTLMAIAGGIGAPHTRAFAEKQLDSLALENVANAMTLLRPYMHEKEIRGVLEASMRSKDWQVRSVAAMALVEDSPEAVAILEQLVADEGKPLHLRMQTVYTLESGPVVEAKAALRRLRSVKNKQVRDMVLEALERLWRPDPRY
jgi:HEAT repeat protein